MEAADTTTRAKIITIKYTNLCEKLKPFLQTQVFPDLSEYDLVDILFYFTLLFTNGEDLYKNNLKTLLMTQGVTLDEDTFDKVHAITLPFIEFLKKFSG